MPVGTSIGGTFFILEFLSRQLSYRWVTRGCSVPTGAGDIEVVISEIGMSETKEGCTMAWVISAGIGGPELPIAESTLK